MNGGPVAPALVGQGQQPAGLIAQAQLVSNAHREFLSPCRTRQKTRVQASPDSFPLGRQSGGACLGVRTFAQVNARSPTRARFLAGPLVSGALLSRGTRLDQADSWPTTSDRIGVWTIPAPDDAACAVRKSHVARPSSKPILTSEHLFDTLEHDRTSTPRPT